MSESIRSNLYRVAESAYAGAFASTTATKLRHTGTTLGLSKETNRSEEIDGSRNLVDLRHGNRQVGGNINFEFSHGSYSDLLLALMMVSNWTGPQPVVLSDSNFSVDASIPGFVYEGGNPVLTDYPNFRPNDIIGVSGFTEPANGGFFRITDIDGTEIHVASVTGGAPGLVNEASGDDIVFLSTSNTADVGAVKKSFTVIRHFADQSSGDKPYHVFRGCMVNKMTLNLVAGKIVTGSFGIIGRDVEYLTDKPSGITTLGAASTTKPMDAFTGGMLIDGAFGTSYIVQELTLTVENGLQPVYELFDDRTNEPSLGMASITGEIGMVFKNANMLEKFLAEENVALTFTLIDKAGNGFSVNLPRLVLTGGQPDTTQKTGPIPLKIPFEAVLDPTLNTSLRIYETPNDV